MQAVILNVFSFFEVNISQGADAQLEGFILNCKTSTDSIVCHYSEDFFFLISNLVEMILSTISFCFFIFLILVVNTSINNECVECPELAEGFI